MTDMKVINYNARKILFSRRLVITAAALAIFAVLITFIRWYAVVDTVRSYSRTFTEYIPRHVLFLWTGYTESLYANRMSTLSSIAVMISDFFPIIFLPMIIILFGTDNYYIDRKYGIIQIVCTRLKKGKYILFQGLWCIMITVSVVSMFLIFQLAVSLIINEVLVKNLLPVIVKMFFSVSDIIPAILKLCLYYSTLAIFVYMLSLFIKRAYVIIMLMPVILSVATSALMIKLFRNDPLALAFTDSGLANPDMKYYWMFVITLWLISVFMFLLRTFMDRKGTIYD